MQFTRMLCWGPLEGQLFGEVMDGGLARPVGGVAVLVGLKPADRTHQDDVPPRSLSDHLPGHGLARDECPLHVDIHDPLPVLDLHVRQRLPVRDACAVEEDVDLPEVLDRASDHVVSTLSGRSRHRREAAPAARGLRFPGHGLQAVRLQAAERDIHPVGRESHGHGPAQGAGAAGHDGRFPLRSNRFLSSSMVFPERMVGFSFMERAGSFFHQSAFGPNPSFPLFPSRFGFKVQHTPSVS